MEHKRPVGQGAHGLFDQRNDCTSVNSGVTHAALKLYIRPILISRAESCMLIQWFAMSTFCGIAWVILTR